MNRQKRNLLTTLVLSQGVPMLLGGDEIGRTQSGNNNAYCQDNEISWFDWSLRDENLALLGFTRRLMDFRSRHAVFRRRKWFQGRGVFGSGISDIGWFNPDGAEMTGDQWNDGLAKCMCVFLNGEEIPDPGPRGERITDDSFLIFFNAFHESLEFTIPNDDYGNAWVAEIDTNAPALEEGTLIYKAAEVIRIEARSVLVLRRDS